MFPKGAGRIHKSVAGRNNDLIVLIFKSGFKLVTYNTHTKEYTFYQIPGMENVNHKNNYTNNQSEKPNLHNIHNRADFDMNIINCFFNPKMTKSHQVIICAKNMREENDESDSEMTPEYVQNGRHLTKRHYSESGVQYSQINLLSGREEPVNDAIFFLLDTKLGKLYLLNVYLARSVRNWLVNEDTNCFLCQGS